MMKEVRDPNWILDRRNSGRLFWRRDSVSEGNRVKFRCDVEVLEFLKTEAERDLDDWSSEDEDDCKHRWRRRIWDEEIPPYSNFWGSVCALAIAAVLVYQWFSG